MSQQSRTPVHPSNWDEVESMVDSLGRNVPPMVCPTCGNMVSVEFTAPPRRSARITCTTCKVETIIDGLPLG